MCDLTGDRPPASYPATGKWEVRGWYHGGSERNHLVLVAPDGKTDMGATFDNLGIGFSLAHDECDARNSEAPRP